MIWFDAKPLGNVALRRRTKRTTAPAKASTTGQAKGTRTAQILALLAMNPRGTLYRNAA